jgi:8-oxo-dGTP pyrophosphatase MutT (NUDIX family)
VRKRRGDVHRDGDWHAALHVWVGGIGPGGPFVVFQRRSRTKDTWPGYLDVAVGGHVRAGEALGEAVREAEEEIGLAVALGDLTPLGRRFVASGSDREVQSVLAVRRDDPLSAYRPHPDEVDAVASLPLGDALALFRRERDVARGIELARGAAAPRALEARATDFAQQGDGSYQALALERLGGLLRGRAPAPFELRH